MFTELLITGAVLLFGTPPAAVGYWVWGRRRARRRNADERCAGCGGALYAPGSYEGPSLVEGVLNCALCSGRLRSRVGAGFAIIGAWSAALGVVAVGGVAADGTAFLPIAALLAGEAILISGGSLAFMRRKNRLALRAMENRGEILPPAS